MAQDPKTLAAKDKNEPVQPFKQLKLQSLVLGANAWHRRSSSASHNGGSASLITPSVESGSRECYVNTVRSSL